jgi:methyl-accepting chemotaxis protein
MTLATTLRDNKAVCVAAGAGDLAAEKLRELPETVARLRETATRMQGDVKENATKARKDMRGTVTKYQGELRENVTKFRTRMDTKDLPGAAVSYVTHSATRMVEIIDELAERGKKVVGHAEAVTEEIEAGTKATARQAKTAVSETKKTAQAAAKKTGSAARS